LIIPACPKLVAQTSALELVTSDSALLSVGFSEEDKTKVNQERVFSYRLVASDSALLSVGFSEQDKTKVNQKRPVGDYPLAVRVFSSQYSVVSQKNSPRLSVVRCQPEGQSAVLSSQSSVKPTPFTAN